MQGSPRSCWSSLGRAGVAALLAIVLAAGLAGPVAAAGRMLIQIDSPGSGESVGGPVAVVGWAVDLDAASGTGVERVLVFLDGDQSQGTPLGVARYGIERPDVVAALQNPGFLSSGFQFHVDPPA